MKRSEACYKSVPEALILPLMFLVAAAISVGCLSDSDRCLDGYTYLPEYEACVLDEDTEEEPDAGEEDSDSDTDDDGGPEDDAGSEDDGIPEGFGEECYGDKDCADYEADFCMDLDEPGYCTITDCDFGACPESYQCCDCSNLGYPQACVTDAHAEEYGDWCVKCG